jgi:hypothetical protein
MSEGRLVRILFLVLLALFTAVLILGARPS